MKPRGNHGAQNCPMPNGVVHYSNNQNHTDNQHNRGGMNGNMCHQTSDKHGAAVRDVKPELITSYASQKKRLLAKAQSECLITMKQEPGVHENAPTMVMENNTPKTIKGYLNG